VSGRSYSDTGLTATATYCYKVQASNQWGFGPASPERCVTPTAPPPTPPPTAPSAPPAAPAPPAQPSPEPEEIVLADLSRSRRSLRVSRRGVYVWAFRATPSALGRVTFTTRIGRRTVRLGSKRFRADSRRSVRPRLRLARRHMRLLRARKRLRVRATVVLAGRKSSRTFTLKSP